MPEVRPVDSMLKRSILVLVAALFGAQAVGFLLIVLGYGVGADLFEIFLATSVVYHAGLAAFLVWRRGDFRRESPDATGVPVVSLSGALPDESNLIPRVNIPNILTIFRLSAIPTAVFLILLSRHVYLLPVVLPFLTVVFLTDFFDGILARRLREITLVGRYLDSISDYFILTATSIVFYLFGLIGLWLFVLILARLVIFAALMAVAAFSQGKASPVSTFLGKASVFAIMGLFVWEIVEYFGVPYIGAHIVVRVVEYVVAAIIAASLVDKAIFLRRLFGGKLT